MVLRTNDDAVMLPRLAVTVLAVPFFLATVACGSDGDAPGGSESSPLRLEASFYPLAWISEQVGGDAVEVASLTPPGAEPHDLELPPSAVADISKADVVVYLEGFQPAVDEAIGELDDAKVFDAAQATDLDLTYTPIEEGEQHEDEAGSTDPHFWLDPTKLIEVADALAERLGEIDPDHAADYSANASTLTGALDTLDRDLEAGLANCESEDVVTSHNAFGYLAQRYGLTQRGITGLTPEDEPTPQQLAAVTTFVEENDVATIYFETLVPEDIARTVAEETGADTAVLDPLEGLSDESAGDDYLAIMKANLASLRAGQPCR